MDGVPEIIPEAYMDINGEPINPAKREPPAEFIETGISTIDIMNSLVRGQKLPIFSGAGLPHDRLAIQIAHQAHLRKSGGRAAPGNEFAMVFVAIGVPFDSAERFPRWIRSDALSGWLNLNLADDSRTVAVARRRRRIAP